MILAATNLIYMICTDVADTAECMALAIAYSISYICYLKWSFFRPYRIVVPTVVYSTYGVPVNPPVYVQQPPPPTIVYQQQPSPQVVYSQPPPYYKS